MVIKKERFECSLFKMIDVASLLLKTLLVFKFDRSSERLKIDLGSSCSLCFFHKFNSCNNYPISELFTELKWIHKFMRY